MLKQAITATALVLLFSGSSAWADKMKVTGAEMEEALAGNTVSGTWGGTEYKQYYRDDGFTVYVPEGGESDEGKWRVNEDGTYGSWWSSTGWVSYGLVRDGETYYWVDGDGGEHPFEILEGKQVSW